MPSEPSQPMSWNKLSSFVVCLILVTFGTLYWRASGTQQTISQAKQTGEGNVPRWEKGILRIPAESSASMGVHVAEIKSSPGVRTLRLTGRLAIDPNALVHVNSRFPGEVISVNQRSANQHPNSAADVAIGIGQSVTKGELLATLWSKEIGEKKSDLVDALSQLYLHRAIFERLSKVKTSDAIPQRSIDEIQRSYESDIIQVERVRRTLVSWNIPEQELEQIEKEAQRIHQQALAENPDATPAPDNVSLSKDWANVELRAPISGMVLERNMTIGDIVGTDEDLFKIADVSKLRILVNVFEEDLAKILRLDESQRTWEVTVNASESNQPIVCRIEYIGHIIDPNQHTALLQGTLDNSDGRWRAGRFVEAVVQIPEPKPVLEIPTAAVVDNGDQTFVLVQKEANTVEPIRIKLLKRTPQTSWLSAEHPGLKVGDRVVTTRSIELFSLMDLSTLKPINAP